MSRAIFPSFIPGQRPFAKMAFRDASVVVIETARTVVRAALGLHELLRTPSVVSPRLCNSWTSRTDVDVDYSSTRWPSKKRERQ